MRIAFIISISIFASVLAFAQELDRATKNKIWVQFELAKEAYEKKDYNATLERIDAVDKLAGKIRLPSALNLKIKALIGLGETEDARAALDELYTLELNNDIVDDIAQHESRLAELIEKERRAIEKEKQERLALEEKEREEKEAWDLAKRINDIGGYNTFLQQYSSGRYSDEARKRKSSLIETVQQKEAKRYFESKYDGGVPLVPYSEPGKNKQFAGVGYINAHGLAPFGYKYKAAGPFDEHGYALVRKSWEYGRNSNLIRSDGSEALKSWCISLRKVGNVWVVEEEPHSFSILASNNLEKVNQKSLHHVESFRIEASGSNSPVELLLPYTGDSVARVLARKYGVLGGNQTVGIFDPDSVRYLVSFGRYNQIKRVQSAPVNWPYLVVGVRIQEGKSRPYEINGRDVWYGGDTFVWGIIDLHGNELIPAEYERIKYINDNMVSVKKFRKRKESVLELR